MRFHAVLCRYPDVRNKTAEWLLSYVRMLHEEEWGYLERAISELTVAL